MSIAALPLVLIPLLILIPLSLLFTGRSLRTGMTLIHVVYNLVTASSFSRLPR